MNTIYLRKTLLAVSISMAASHAFADSFDISANRGEDAFTGSYANGLTLTGSYEGSDDGAEFAGSQITGDLVNEANITSVDNGYTDETNTFVNDPSGIDFDYSEVETSPGSGVYEDGEPTRVSGNVINRGIIFSEGRDATGILVDSAQIGGLFINEAMGDITASGISGEMASLAGVMFQGATIGGFENYGSIKALGADSTALSMIEGTSITGDRFFNAGTIVAEGENVEAVELEHLAFTGKFVNDGVILGKGINSQGVSLEEGAQLHSIVNNGSIVGSGEGAVAIQIGSNYLDDGADYQSPTVDVGIVNTGVIDGQEIAIKVNNFNVNPDTVDGDFETEVGYGFFQIHQMAGEITGRIAIQGNEKTDLDWFGGNINGKLYGLSEVDVYGVANFGGDVIEVNEEVNIFDGAQLNFTQPHSYIMKSDRAVQNGWDDQYTGGNLLVATGGTLGLALSGATDATRPILLVEGTATFEKDSVVMLNATVDDFSSTGKTYKLIQAGSLVDNGLLLKSSSALLSVSNLNITPTSLGADVSKPEATQPTEPTPTEPTDPTDPTPTEPTPIPTPTEPTPTEPAKPGDGTVVVAPNSEETNKAVIAQGGGNSNAQAAGARFVSLMGNLNSNDAIANALIKAGNDTAAIARIAAQLAPEVNGGSTQAAMGGQSMISTAIGGRMGAARSGMSSGEGFDEVGGWIQVLSSDANQDMRDGIEGYSSDSKGLLFGADGKLNEQTTLGLSYSFINSDVASDLGNKTDVDTHALTAYGSWADNGLFVDGSVTYGLSKNDAERFIAGTKSTANYDSSLFGLNVMSGYAFDLSNGLVVEPRIAGRYSKVTTEKYDEKGSSGSLSIQNEQRMEVAELGAGVRLAGQFDIAGGLLTPEAKVMAFHDFIGDQAKTEAAFLAGGDSFNTFGATSARDTYEFGLGASYRRDQVTFTVGYDRQMKSGFDADTFTAKVRYDF